MRIRFTCTLALLASLTGAARADTYYVANHGSDTNMGTTAGAPFQTISHAAGMLSSGDTVLLNRGDTFRESVSIGPSNVTVDAYGGGDLPIVSGSTPVTGWALLYDSIYLANLSASIGHFYANKNLMTLARWPNTDWARTTSWTENADGSNTVIHSSQLAGHPNNADDYWNDAQIRWRRHSWWFETRDIDGYAATGHLHLAGSSLIHIMPYDMNGWGFYLDNKFEELDYPGEYYHDYGAGRAFFYAPGGVDPDTMIVEASVRDSGLSVSGSTVRNIAFEQQKLYGLQITGSTIVENCRFDTIGSDAGGAALRATWNVKNALVRYNLFRNNLNAAINWNEDPTHGGTSYIEHNELIDNGVVDGYGGSGSWHAAGIIVSNARDLHVQYNHIDGTGYAAIILGQPGNYAEYNVIASAMSTLNDGAAIYTNCDNSVIRYNIIRDTRGGMDASGPWANLAHGIWTEFLSEFKDQVIVANTVTGSGGFGIFFENNFTSEVRDNIFFNNDRAQFFLAGRGTATPQNHAILNNVLYANTEDQRTLLFDVDYDYGVVDGNYYINPYTDRHITPATASWQWQPALTLGEWQSQYVWADANAKLSPITLTTPPTPADPLGTARVFVNETEQVKTFDLGDAVYMDLDGNPVTGTFDLDPFRGRILIVLSCPPGDLDGDGFVDATDIDLLHDAVNGGAGSSVFDLNGDGEVDRVDVDYMVRTLLATEYGDADLDGDVDLDDFVVLKIHFGVGTSWMHGDFDGDRNVGLDDFVVLKLNFGAATSSGDSR